MKTKVKDWVGEASFDSTQKYRWSLTRRFICRGCGDAKGLFECDCRTWKNKVVFIMLNPSTATAEESDPTVTRCEGYARLWKYRRLIVLNIFALRSTDPELLYSDPDPVGRDNNINIQNCSKDAGLIICAWGVHGKYQDRGQKVLEMLRHKKPHYLKLTKEGIPQHPLYLKANLKPKLFSDN